MGFDVAALRRIGRYPVDHFVAEGGMAWVFRVTDPELFNAPRALKLLKPQAAGGEDYQRFLAEAQILATIQHPNLIHVYDFGQDAGTGCHFYTMDFIEGSTLCDIPPDWLDEADEEEEEDEEESVDVAPVETEIDPNATSFIHVRPAPARVRYTVTDVCEYFCGVLAALARLHRENVVHRDIKPENIFLTHDRIPILGDLGIATGRHSAKISEVGRVPGTPLYMSPEHALGEPTTVRSDVFSLGLSLYTVLSGETVYDQIDDLDATDGQAVLQHLVSLQAEDKEFEFFGHESIPDSVLDVIETACSIKESERFASADDFNNALRDALDGVSGAYAGGIRPLVAAAIALPVLALTGYFAWQVLIEESQIGPTQEDVDKILEVERQNIRDRELAAQRDIDALKDKLERAMKSVGDGASAQRDIDALKAALEEAKKQGEAEAESKAALTAALNEAKIQSEAEKENKAALLIAQKRAKELEDARLSENLRLEEERKIAAKREADARRQLEELRLALLQEKNKPPPVALPPPPAEDLGLRKAMESYESAYESRSIEDLNRVWSMSRFQRVFLEQLFEDCGQIRVLLSFTDSNITGSDAQVDFDENILYNKCNKTKAGSRYSELTALLARRGDEWQIKEIRERNERSKN